VVAGWGALPSTLTLLLVRRGGRPGSDQGSGRPGGGRRRLTTARRAAAWGRARRRFFWADRARGAPSRFVRAVGGGGGGARDGGWAVGGVGRGDAVAAVLELAMANTTPTPAARLELLERVISAIQSDHVPAIVVGRGSSRLMAGPVLAGVRARVAPALSAGRAVHGSRIGRSGGGDFPPPPPPAHRRCFFGGCGRG